MTPDPCWRIEFAAISRGTLSLSTEVGIYPKQKLGFAHSLRWVDPTLDAMRHASPSILTCVVRRRSAARSYAECQTDPTSHLASAGRLNCDAQTGHHKTAWRPRAKIAVAQRRLPSQILAKSRRDTLSG